jgi:hypothetical protein
MGKESVMAHRNLHTVKRAALQIRGRRHSPQRRVEFGMWCWFLLVLLIGVILLAILRV